jgi:hypothetical protein
LAAQAGEGNQQTTSNVQLSAPECQRDDLAIEVGSCQGWSRWPKMPLVGDPWWSLAIFCHFRYFSGEEIFSNQQMFWRMGPSIVFQYFPMIFI